MACRPTPRSRTGRAPANRRACDRRTGGGPWAAEPGDGEDGHSCGTRAASTPPPPATSTSSARRSTSRSRRGGARASSSSTPSRSTCAHTARRASTRPGTADERGGAVLIAVGGDDQAARWSGRSASPPTNGRLDRLPPRATTPAATAPIGRRGRRGRDRQRGAAATAQRHLQSCEDHLGRLIREPAAHDGFNPDDPAAPSYSAARMSIHDRGWPPAFAVARQAVELEGWWTNLDAVDPPAGRPPPPVFGFPRSNAAADRILDWIDRRFGNRWRYSLRIAGPAPPRARARARLPRGPGRVARRRQRQGCGGRPAPRPHFAWTARLAPRGTPCSIGQLIVDAHDRAAKGKATYDAAAKARSVIADIAALKASLAEIGLPPMEATVGPRRTTASVKVAAGCSPTSARAARLGQRGERPARHDRSRPDPATRSAWRCPAAGPRGRSRSLSGRSSRPADSGAPPSGGRPRRARCGPADLVPDRDALSNGTFGRTSPK